MIPMFAGLALIALGVTGRLLPHPDNFTPAASVGLFAGFFFASPLTAAGVMLAVMLVSDSVVGFYDAPVLIAVYAALLFPLIFRRALRSSPAPAENLTEGWVFYRLSALRVLFAATASSVVFFLATNLACWLCWYPLTGEAFVECYVNALPFFRNTLLGDLAWSSGLFLTYASVAAYVRQHALVRVRQS